MKDFSALMTEEFNTQREHWEKALKAELKLEDIGGKTSKKHLDLGPWPTLSLKAAHCFELTSGTAWKKAAQTYLRIQSGPFVDRLKEDLDAGVKAFFFHGELLTSTDCELIQKTLLKFERIDELEIYILGHGNFSFDKRLKIISGQQMVTASDVAANGGHNVHELAVLTLKLIESLGQLPSHLGVYMDSHFFKNIAKVRALKLLAQKVLSESQVDASLKIVTLNSYREWTLYERYSNMLRNDVQVASGMVAGADAIQSSGYQVLFNFETNSEDSEHEERSLRMARNTSHILNAESMLGVVGDAAFGSYHLENLTHQYAEEAWTLMQQLLKLSTDQRLAFINNEIDKVRELRLERVKSRKDVQAGMNDFPNGSEVLGVSLRTPSFFRVARPFEELRLVVEKLDSRPKVHIHLLGDYGTLNNRINFIKNYFELIGLEVIDPMHPQRSLPADILVICAKDEDYGELAQKFHSHPALIKYVAGKVQLDGYLSIFAGQNVFQILEQLVKKIVGEK